MGQNTPKDGLGNELEIGNIVQLRVGPAQIIGHITDLRCGGVLAPTATLAKGSDVPGGMELPGELKIVAEYSIRFKPGSYLFDVLKLHEPRKREPQTS